MDELGGGPERAGEARQHEVGGTEEDHRRERVGQELLLAGGEGREAGHRIVTTETEDRVEDAEDREGDGAETHEAQRGIIPRTGPAAFGRKRAVKVDSGDDHRDDQHRAGHDADGLEPERHRGADEGGWTGPTREEDERPEGHGGEIVTADGSIEHLGQEIVDGGEGGGAKPEQEEVRDEPAMGDGLDDARSRLPEDEQLGQEVGQWEGERGADHKPLRSEGVTRGATGEGDDRPETGEQEGDGKYRADFARELQEAKTSLVTSEDLNHAVSEGEIPKHATEGRQPAVTEFEATELREQPEIKSEEGVKAPAIDE